MGEETEAWPYSKEIWVLFLLQSIGLLSFWNFVLKQAEANRWPLPKSKITKFLNTVSMADRNQFRKGNPGTYTTLWFHFWVTDTLYSNSVSHSYKIPQQAMRLLT